jgi:hypothetical protein
MADTCKTCQHSDHNVHETANRVVYTLQCRRYPPPFPPVREEWVCGEHEPAAQAEQDPAARPRTLNDPPLGD